MSSPEKTITEVAYQTEEQTNDDGSVMAEIATDGVTYDEENDEVVIEFYTPIGETKTQSFPRPERADPNEYEIVNIAEQYIGSFSAIGQMEEMNIRVDPDEWEILSPPTTLNRFENAAATVSEYAVPLYEVLLILTALLQIFTFAWVPVIAIASVIITGSTAGPFGLGEYIAVSFGLFLSGLALANVADDTFE